MNVVPVDERDAAWEDGDPRFKVILFEPAGSWSVSTYDLDGCGVLDAIAWAERHVSPQGAWAVGLIIELPEPSGIGFTYLEGFDLNAQAKDLSHWERDQVDRMLRRRGTRVVLGED